MTNETINTNTEPTTIKGMIAELDHGDLGYSIIYHDRVLNTIKTGIGDFDREDGETQKSFLKRVKKLVLEEDFADTVITISN